MSSTIKLYYSIRLDPLLKKQLLMINITNRNSINNEFLFVTFFHHVILSAEVVSMMLHFSDETHEHTDLITEP